MFPLDVLHAGGLLITVAIGATSMLAPQYLAGCTATELAKHGESKDDLFDESHFTTWKRAYPTQVEKVHCGVFDRMIEDVKFRNEDDFKVPSVHMQERV
ncbi:Uu.00g144380.m01.CDS01 [Anthostomella pinea]|uniref:Uu.00g144380.m01.CDS01 n=1 Tax=Anthostomella pinea TaxID=933095 RepID=A0AAI8VQU9_9PEZI|nr:Uu.00g144380.m01.CDS01 [Anthostomella pinea]